MVTLPPMQEFWENFLRGTMYALGAIVMYGILHIISRKKKGLKKYTKHIGFK